MSALREKVLSIFKERRQRIFDGKINSIPTPFKRFSNDFIGFEKGTYMIVTSYTKGGKSQLVSFLLYKAIMYAYDNPSSVSVKVLYFNIEETKENIVTRFISWLLYEHTKGKYRLSPSDLMSSKNDTPLTDEVLAIIESNDFADKVDYFVNSIIFSDESNPTGINKFCLNYLNSNGTVFTKPAKYKDELGILRETQTFDYYVPNNPDEYVFALVDTVNIIKTERGMGKMESINKLSEYFVNLRNNFKISPIIIQQQNTDNEGIESVKYGRTRPSTSGLRDSKATSHDANIVLGLYSPFKFGLKEYLGYPIDILKDHFRTLEVLINRNGELGGIVPLFFDGAICNWAEMPRLDDNVGLNKIYNYVRMINNSVARSFLFKRLNEQFSINLGRFWKWKINFHKRT